MTLPVKVDRTAIILGLDDHDKPVPLPRLIRGSHIHMIGATGGGKSSCILSMARQLIVQKEGVLFVDPHGSHSDSGFRNILIWLERRGFLGTRKVHIIDFDATTHTVGFNPLALPDDQTDVSVIASTNLEAMSVSWDDESTAQKPTIERNLAVAFSVLSELHLTFLEAPMLFDREDANGLRAYAIEHVKDDYIRSELKRLHHLASSPRRERDWDMEIVGPMNRLARLLRPKALRSMLGQRESTLDIAQALDEGHIILANLSGGSQVYDKDADLFGRLLTRSFLFHAKRRKNTRPFTMILDECQRYLSGDLPTLLGEARKYGVSLLLSHQWLTQLEVHDENLLAAVKGSTACKICFRIRDAKDAEELAHSLIPLNLEIPVRTLIRPTLIGHARTWLSNRGKTEQQSETETRSTTKGTSRGTAITEGATSAATETESESLSEAAHPDPEAEPFREVFSTGLQTSSASADTFTFTTSEGSMEAATHGKGTTAGKGTSEGQSEAIQPLMAHMPTSVHGKDNVLYMAGHMLRTLKIGTAYLNYIGKHGMVSTIVTVPPIFTEQHENFNALRDKVLADSSAAVPTDKALALIADRHKNIVPKPKPIEPPDKPSRKRRW